LTFQQTPHLTADRQIHSANNQMVAKMHIICFMEINFQKKLQLTEKQQIEALKK
jgi:hypothetical protein